MAKNADSVFLFTSLTFFIEQDAVEIQNSQISGTDAHRDEVNVYQ